MIRAGCTMLLVAMAMSGCLSGPEPEPTPVGRIDGAVIDHMLGPWAGVDVHLVEMDRWTTTNDLGGFSFLDVPPGIHTVAIENDAARTANWSSSTPGKSARSSSRSGTCRKPNPTSPN